MRSSSSSALPLRDNCPSQAENNCRLREETYAFQLKLIAAVNLQEGLPVLATFLLVTFEIRTGENERMQKTWTMELRVWLPGDCAHKKGKKREPYLSIEFDPHQSINFGCLIKKDTLICIHQKSKMFAGSQSTSLSFDFFEDVNQENFCKHRKSVSNSCQVWVWKSRSSVKGYPSYCWSVRTSDVDVFALPMWLLQPKRESKWTIFTRLGKS